MASSGLTTPPCGVPFVRSTRVPSGHSIGARSPRPNVETDPSQIRVMGHGAFDKVMRNGIKEGLDVQIDDPVDLPTAFPRHPDCVERRTAGSIAVGVRMEPRFHLRLQDHLDDRLRHAVGDRRNAERSRAAVVLRYLDEPHGRRMIRARRHPIPDLVQVTLQVPLERRQGTHHPHPQHRGSPSPAGKLPRRVASECHKASPQTPAPPLSGWPTSSARVSGPFAPPALPGFIATTDPSVPAPRIGTRRLAGLPLGDLPWHRGDRFPRSAQEPLTGLTPSSCRSPLGQSAGSVFRRAKLTP